MLVDSLLHTSTSPIAAAHISLYMWQPLTQQAIFFPQAISSACSAISSSNAHLANYFHSIWSVQKLFYANIFWMKMKKGGLQYIQQKIMALQ